MPRVILFTSRDPRRLLGAAAEGFLRQPDGSTPFPSPHYYLVLRQGGLRDDLLALAAESGVRGWFDPPIALFQQLPDLLADLPRTQVGDFERVVLVGRALRECAGETFGRLRNVDAYADTVDRWFGELVAEGIDPNALAAATKHIASDSFARRRDTELVATYRRYLELLDEAGLRDSRARLIDCASALRDDPAALPQRLGGRRELRVVGLSDPRGGWVALLQALKKNAALERVAIYAADALPFLVQIADETVTLDATPHFTTRIFPATGTAAQTQPEIQLVSAPDLPREVEVIAIRVRALIDAGTPPQRIAVIARSARPYTSHMIRTLERMNVPASARRRHALAEVPALRALLALFRVAAEGWERAGLVELAETPFFRARLDAGVLNHIGYRNRVRGLSAWSTAIAELQRAATEREARLEQNPDDDEARRNPLPSSARIAQALDNFATVAALAGSLDVSRTVAEWLDWLTSFINGDAWGLQRTMYRAPGNRFDAVRLDVVAWNAMRDIVAEWAGAEIRWGGADVIDVREFEARLRAVLSGDAVLYTPARRGVQVLEGLAAAFRSFDHVFLVGLDSARAPVRMPPSPLLGDDERITLRDAGLSIDTRVQWQEREQALFTNLLATATMSLTLSFSRYDDTGAEQLPSAYLEEAQHALGLTTTEIAGSRAFTPGVPLIPDAATLAHAMRAALAEHARAYSPASPHNGRIEDLTMRDYLATELGDAKIWSPTQIESYAKCPWAYFSGRLLRLEKVDDPDLDISPLTRGAILHDALRRFYTTARERIGAAVHLRPADLHWALPLAHTAIRDAIDHARQSEHTGHPALEAQKYAELSRQLIAFIEWEAEENENAATRPQTNAAKWVRTDVAEHEVEFNDVVLENDGILVRFRGFIDRIEISNDPRNGARNLLAAVDYKSTRYSTPAGGNASGWKDGVVLQVPLYAYALTQIRPGSGTARVEYRAIKNRQRVHTLPLYTYCKNTLVEDEKARAKYEQALRDVARHVGSARKGEFAPNPPPSCNCPPFCHGRDICRIPDGPRGRK